MNLTINGEKLTVKLESSEELKLEEVVTAFQLSTGNYEALFVPKENDFDEKVDNFEEKQPRHVEYREESTDHVERQEKRGKYFERGETVNVEVLCPFCGYVGKAMTRFGNSFCKCPKCKEKLFNAWAEGWEEAGSKGFVYRASEAMVFKNEPNVYEEMFKEDATND